MVNKIFALLTLIAVIALIAAVIVIEVSRPRMENSDPVTLQQGEEALTKEKDSTLCYPRGSSACIESAN